MSHPIAYATQDDAARGVSIHTEPNRQGALLGHLVFFAWEEARRPRLMFHKGEAYRIQWGDTPHD